VLLVVAVPAVISVPVWFALSRRCTRRGRVSGYVAWTCVSVLAGFWGGGDCQHRLACCASGGAPSPRGLAHAVLSNPAHRPVERPNTKGSSHEHQGRAFAVPLKGREPAPGERIAGRSCFRSARRISASCGAAPVSADCRARVPPRGAGYRNRGEPIVGAGGA
jgi:hypothetical protein